jgi:hypothetical protein
LSKSDYFSCVLIKLNRVDCQDQYCTKDIPQGAIGMKQNLSHLYNFSGLVRGCIVEAEIKWNFLPSALSEELSISWFCVSVKGAI